mmetsp:Transcript_73153/g.223765  ORF Transcript_73153/g.223765 Transcript_73153/m.223765 type:complete len:206 (+) Transcript_73153:1402-2019(+)
MRIRTTAKGPPASYNMEWTCARTVARGVLKARSVLCQIREKGLAEINAGGVTTVGNLLTSFGEAASAFPRNTKSVGIKRFGSGNRNRSKGGSAASRASRRHRSIVASPRGSSLKGAPYQGSTFQPVDAALSAVAMSLKPMLVRKIMQFSAVNVSMYSRMTSGLHSSTAKGPRSACCAGYLNKDIAVDMAKSSGAGKSSLWAKLTS